MTTVKLKTGWSLKFTLIEVRDWCREKCIIEDDCEFFWNTTIDEDGVNAAIEFKNENDALAFRLKFGI